MQLGWIDFSKEERNKVLATLKLLGMQTALDELGIGAVRDAYADMLFPGLSTIQTRAKYFVLIPYIFARAEKQSYIRNHEVLEWINRFEDRLVPVLVNNSGPKENGIIGSDAMKQKGVVKLKPTSIYWNGLRTFEIIRNNRISLRNACDIIIAKSKRLKSNTLKLGVESFNDPNANNGDIVLFSPIQLEYDLEKEIGIDLTYNEAVFLSDKIIKATASKNSLLAFLINKRLNFSSFDEIDAEVLPADMKRDYLHAKSFADFIHIAYLRYNVIYSNYEDNEMALSFEKCKTAFDFISFNINETFNQITCNASTVKFCEEFRACIIADDMTAVDELIIRRERLVKEERAKLRKPAEYHYTPVHKYKLNYRFETAKIIINDIIKGLRDENGKTNV